MFTISRSQVRRIVNSIIRIVPATGSVVSHSGSLCGRFGLRLATLQFLGPSSALQLSSLIIFTCAKRLWKFTLSTVHAGRTYPPSIQLPESLLDDHSEVPAPSNLSSSLYGPVLPPFATRLMSMVGKGTQSLSSMFLYSAQSKIILDGK